MYRIREIILLISSFCILCNCHKAKTEPGGFGPEGENGLSNSIFFQINFTVTPNNTILFELCENYIDAAYINIFKEALSDSMSTLSKKILELAVTFLDTVIIKNEIDEFLSIGTRMLSDSLGIHPNWKWNIAKFEKSPPKLEIRLESEFSRALSKDNSTPFQKALLDIDGCGGKNYRYRAKFKAEALALLHPVRINTVTIGVNAYLSLERKSYFADDKYFAPFKADEIARREWCKQLQRDILNLYWEVYSDEFKDLDINIK